MNRRDFLGALFGTAVVAALPSTALLLEPVTPDWQAALNKVMSAYVNEFVYFGMAALRTTDIFPFIEVVTAKEMLLIPELQRSLGEF